MNQKLVQRIRSMTEEELYAAIYRDQLTQLNNRKAFDETEATIVAIVDMDSLKYLNDTYGHRVGDAYLCELAKGLQDVFGDECVFRIAGDEFAVIGDCAQSLRSGMGRLAMWIPGISMGIGRSVIEADRALRMDKIRREKCGQRAARGECPPWASAINQFA